jgi:hypothetical protein
LILFLGRLIVKIADLVLLLMRLRVRKTLRVVLSAATLGRLRHFVVLARKLWHLRLLAGHRGVINITFPIIAVLIALLFLIFVAVPHRRLVLVVFVLLVVADVISLLLLVLSLNSLAVELLRLLQASVRVNGGNRLVILLLEIGVGHIFVMILVEVAVVAVRLLRFRALLLLRHLDGLHVELAVARHLPAQLVILALMLRHVKLFDKGGDRLSFVFEQLTVPRHLIWAVLLIGATDQVLEALEQVVEEVTPRLRLLRRGLFP